MMRQMFRSGRSLGLLLSGCLAGALLGFVLRGAASSDARADAPPAKTPDLAALAADVEC